MKAWIAVIMLVTALWPAGVVPEPAVPLPRQDDPTREQVDQIIATLSAHERVGQLMMVTFQGSDIGSDSPVARLIHDYNIGGVVLRAENDNIGGSVNTPHLIYSLTSDLQQRAYESAEAAPRAFVPLFIAVSHLGDRSPSTQIVTGTTPLPSQMAVGATWKPDHAQTVGQIAGIELEAMGINMLLGPALDIAQPSAGRAFDLGVNTFGGHPDWVGAMGRAYITGVHEGSQGRIAVIAQNFPGLGQADTSPSLQIPVVPRSLEELRRFDLVPYAAVADVADTPLARADGFQCANLRYLGPSIRSVTRPICVDESAAGQLFGLEEFVDWREDGILISSPLGTHALRRFYGTTPFPQRQVARDAFLAGSDLLFLDDFGARPGGDPAGNITNAIQYFAERYEADPIFRARVDISLRRILRLKLRLYNLDLSNENVQTPNNELSYVGRGHPLLYTIAQHGTTLLSPRRESLPPPPARQDNLVIFTDVRLAQQCSTCPTYPLVAVNALEAAIEQLYGPQAGAQIRPERVVSFSFNQLQTYLQTNSVGLTGDSSQLRTMQSVSEALINADWVIFVMLDISPDVAASSLVRDLLVSESAVVENTRVVVIALGAPIYLSATEISRFAAYYGLYSATPPYLDAAARALFQESAISGAPPISVPAVGYDVLAVTSPVPASLDRIAAPPSVSVSDGLQRRRLEALDLVLSLFGLVLLSMAGLWVGRAWTHRMEGGIRVLLGCVVAGLTGYIYYGVDGPGVRELYAQVTDLAPLLVTLVSGLVGILATWWLLRHER